MLTDLKVKVGPQFYRYHEGALAHIPELLQEYQAKRLLIVHGSISWQKAQPKLTFINEAPGCFLSSVYWGMQLLRCKFDQRSSRSTSH